MKELKLTNLLEMALPGITSAQSYPGRILRGHTVLPGKLNEHKRNFTGKSISRTLISTIKNMYHPSIKPEIGICVK